MSIVWNNITSTLRYLRDLFSWTEEDSAQAYIALGRPDRNLWLDEADPKPPARCVCGQPYIRTTFNAWDIRLDGEMTYRALSCATPGCPGNIVEWHRDRVEALEKLTHHDREVLGLTWTMPSGGKEKAK